MRRITAFAITLLALGLQPAFGYQQLVGLPTLNGGDGTPLNSGTIDGTTGYAVLSGSGLHRIVKIDDLGGANTVTTLVDTASWNTTVGGAPSGIAGVPYISGSLLLIADLVTDQVVQVDTTSGAASLLVDSTTIGGSIGFSGLNLSNGNLLVYQSAADALYETTGVFNGFTEILDDVGLTTVTGDDTPSGVSGAADGKIYFGQGTDSVGEDITYYDPSGPSNGILATEAQIVGTGDVGFSTTAFNILADGILYFRDGGTNDSIRSIDPTTGVGSLMVEYDEATLVAGPAKSDFVSSFSLWNNQLAWTQTLDSGDQVPGFYTIPEPSTMTLFLAGMLGLAAARRRS